MDRYEPQRWLATAAEREDVRSLNLSNAPRPQLVFRPSPFILKDATREVRFYFLGWAHTRGDGFVWLPKERILCTGDAAVNGPRNKLWDANLANWPRVLSRALAFHPLHVLPGHGDAGGARNSHRPETVSRGFVCRRHAASRRRQNAQPDHACAPRARPQLDPKRPHSTDFSIAYAEITQHKPAGDLPHVWK